MDVVGVVPMVVVVLVVVPSVVSAGTVLEKVPGVMVLFSDTVQGGHRSEVVVEVVAAAAVVRIGWVVDIVVVEVTVGLGVTDVVYLVVVELSVTGLVVVTRPVMVFTGVVPEAGLEYSTLPVKGSVAGVLPRAPPSFSEPCVGASDTVESIPTVEGAGVVVEVVVVVVVTDWAARRLKWSL